MILTTPRPYRHEVKPLEIGFFGKSFYIERGPFDFEVLSRHEAGHEVVEMLLPSVSNYNVSVDQVIQARSGDCVFATFLNLQSILSVLDASLDTQDNPFQGGVIPTNEIDILKSRMSVNPEYSYSQVAADSPLTNLDAVQLIQSIYGRGIEQNDIVYASEVRNKVGLIDILDYYDSKEYGSTYPRVIFVGKNRHATAIIQIGSGYILIDPFMNMLKVLEIKELVDQLAPIIGDSTSFFLGLRKY